MVISAMGVSAAIGGSGTVDDPYTLNSAEDVKAFSDSVKAGNTFSGKFIKLTADVDLFQVSQPNWQPIGWYVSATKNFPFEGNFDGDGHTVSGASFNDDYQSYVGLFGIVRYGVVSNLIVKNFRLTGLDNVGAVVGAMSESAVLKNVKAVNCSVFGERFVGGVVGQMSESAVAEECQNEGSVSAERICGGIVGWLDRKSTVRDCLNGGHVQGRSYNVGGVVGSSTKNSRIEACANYGSVKSRGRKTGGIVGYIDNSTLYMCSNTGKVEMTDDYAGGICGYARRTSVSSSVNAAVVERINPDKNGKAKCIGGISGYAADGTSITRSLNCNDVVGGDKSGAIIGYKRRSDLSNTYYDGQMCVSHYAYGNKKASAADSARLLTNQMLGDSLKGKLNGEWVYTDGRYPRLKGYLSNDVAMAASAPFIFSDTTENVYTIADSFSMTDIDGTDWVSSNNVVMTKEGRNDGRILEIGFDTLFLEKDGVQLRSIPIKTVHRIPFTDIIAEKDFTMDVDADTTLHMLEDLPEGVWSSDNEDVLVVNAETGHVIALKKGTAVVTCTLSNGDKQSITITVTDELGDKARAEELAEKITVHFDFNNAWDGHMSEQEQAAYDELVSLLVEHSDMKIVLTGNTCDIGSYDVNVRMGMLRAATIKKWMVRKGVKADNIEVRSMAYDNPVKDNSTPEHRRQNRRVQVSILHN